MPKFKIQNHTAHSATVSNNMKQLFIYSLLLFFTITCKNESTKAIDKEDYKEKSFKQKLQTNKDLKSEILFDEEKKIYSNLEYGITVNFPDNWETDMGTTQNSLIRGFERDSGITMIIVPIEIKKGTETYKAQNQLLEFYAENEEMFNKTMTNNLEQNLQTRIFSFTSKKSFINNQPTIQSKFIYIMRHLDEEYEQMNIQHQFWREPYSYTVSLSLPLLFYNENPKQYEWLFTNISFTK